ncbi:MAG TPA: hypothetical protein PKC30_04285 [Saprospiraceae bacterium]|nr:hypothetical protein [Saprospiraceae bacterium]
MNQFINHLTGFMNARIIPVQLFIGLFITIIIYSPDIFSQDSPPSSPEEIEKVYQYNIKKTRINGVYIPKDIHEAIQEIIILSPKDALQKFSNADEDFVVKRLHFGIGRWISVNWNFIEGSRYVHYLRSMGVTDEDDMIEFTLRNLHKHLNQRDLDIESLAARMKQRRKEDFERKIISKEILQKDSIPGKN